MVIIFREDKPRKFLLKNGEVFTLRINRKKFGRDYMTDGRGHPKICDVMVEDWGKISTDYPLILSKYVKKSGYLTIPEWLEAVKRVNRLKTLPKILQLIRVVKIGNRNLL